ncbi:nucleotidyltransferase domain-containing protein [Candidatus Woesearchaeota archaeon]|nr:nucleotidyltransferase domain-containing protein [Candidatus Woesearchaeota archaeon]
MIQECSIWKVFCEFARNPSKSYQIRELSRIIKLAPTSIKIHLRKLEENNLIKKEKVGVYDAYKVNFNNEDFRFYKKISNLINLKESGIIKELEAKFTPDVILLFGSYAKGEDTENSDIDIFLLAKEKKLDLSKYEKQLNRRFQLFFSENINNLPRELQNNILNGIILSGFIRWKT